MPLDTRIALGIEPIKLADPVAQYNQFAQARAAGNQNALAEYSLSAAQRADVNANALNEAYASSVDPNTGEIDYGKVRNYLAQKNLGSQIPAVEKQRIELGNLNTESQTKQTKLLADKLALLPDAYRMADTPQAYAQLQEQIHADPVVGRWLDSIGATREKGRASLQKAVDEGTFDKLRMGSMQNVAQILDSMKPVTVAAGASVYDPTKGTFAQAPEKAPVPPDAVMMERLGYPLTTEGYKAFRDAQRQDRLLSPEEEAQKTRIALASRPPAAPRPEQPPVAVVDPATGKQIFVSRDEAIAKRLAPASAQESLPPKEIQQREAKYPQATSAVKTFESKSDTLAADLEKLANHPGLSGISGLVYGRTPAVTKDARAAQALYDSIVARGGFAELQSMRASSPTGGALGNVSNQENEYLRDAFAPINRTQDTGDLKTALKNAAITTRTAKQRVRDAYDMTYDYKTGGGAAAPAAAPAAGGGEWKVVK